MRAELIVKASTPQSWALLWSMARIASANQRVGGRRSGGRSGKGVSRRPPPPLRQQRRCVQRNTGKSKAGTQAYGGASVVLVVVRLPLLWEGAAAQCRHVKGSGSIEFSAPPRARRRRRRRRRPPPSLQIAAATAKPKALDSPCEAPLSLAGCLSCNAPSGATRPESGCHQVSCWHSPHGGVGLDGAVCCLGQHISENGKWIGTEAERGRERETEDTLHVLVFV